jgi:hypothetical protein
MNYPQEAVRWCEERRKLKGLTFSTAPDSAACQFQTALQPEAAIATDSGQVWTKSSEALPHLNHPKDRVYDILYHVILFKDLIGVQGA